MAGRGTEIDTSIAWLALPLIIQCNILWLRSGYYRWGDRLFLHSVKQELFSSAGGIRGSIRKKDPRTTGLYTGRLAAELASILESQVYVFVPCFPLYCNVALNPGVVLSLTSCTTYVFLWDRIRASRFLYTLMIISLCRLCLSICRGRGGGG